MDELGQGVGEPAGADVVNGDHRVVGTERPAGIDDLLTTALHLGVSPLHRREVERGGARPRVHAGSSPTTEPDPHGWAAEDGNDGSVAEAALFHVIGPDVSQPAREHDRLVVPAGDLAPYLLEGAEVAGHDRPAELVRETRRTDRGLEHDLERRRDRVRPAVMAFPGLAETRDLQVGHAEAAKSHLRLGAPPGRSLVAKLAPDSGCRPGKGRHRRRVVVRLHLHRRVHCLLVVLVGPGANVGEEPAPEASGDNRGIVGVRRHHSLGVGLTGVLDHLEQRLGLGLTVEGPAGIEGLVAAVLGVHL